jgi:hypothetical protein
MGNANSGQFAYYIYTAEPGVCPDCEALDGTMFLAEHLKEFEAKTTACPRGCFAAIVGVFADEQGAPETARQVRLAGGILKFKDC